MPETQVDELISKGKTWSEALTSIKSRAFFAWVFSTGIFQGLALSAPDWGVVIRLQALQALVTAVYMVAQKWEDVAKARAAGEALNNGSGGTP